MRCRSARGTRTVPAREFFVGALECCLLPDEWAEEVAVPAATDGTGYAVEEFARRHGDYAICGVMAAARRAKRCGSCTSAIASLPVVTDVARRR